MSDSDVKIDSDDIADSPAPESASEESNANEQCTPQKITPGPDAVDISEDKDGGLLKEVLKAGVGEDGPLAGDTVLVHYVGQLASDGSKFDSSRDRDQLFDFKIGKGQVIKGWDVGVATMKRGELARLHCAPEYAYGENGQPPKIPENASLVFEVELFEWKGEDLTSKKDGGVLKTQIVDAEGFETPNEEAACQIHLVGRFEEKVFEERNVNFIMGEGSEAELVQGVELAVKKSRKGERFRIQVAPQYAYGSKGNKTLNIPSNSTLQYEITMKSFEKSKENWEMEKEEKLEQCQIMKNKGAGFFKSGKYTLAKHYYKRMVECLQHETSTFEGENAETRKSLLIAGHLNWAMCEMKQGDNLEVIVQCDKALELDPENEKAFFRRGSAYMNLIDNDSAITDFQKVLSIQPENKAAKNQLSIARGNVRKEKEKEKKIYAGMFDKFAKIDGQNQKSDDQIKSSGDAPNMEDGDSNGEPSSTDSDESSPDENPEMETAEASKV